METPPTFAASATLTRGAKTLRKTGFFSFLKCLLTEAIASITSLFH